MGRSVNKVTLIGTLGRDPEVRFMPNGNAVANLSLATDESYNDKQTGQKVEQTEWHRITVYGKLAEIVQQYLKKGSKAYFEGKLRTREWEKDGVKRYTTEIIANDMLMLDSRGDSQGMGAPAGGFQSASQMMNPGAAPMGGMNSAPQAAPQQAPQGGYQQPAAAPQQAQQPMNPAGGYQQQPAMAPQQAAPQQQRPAQAPQQQPQAAPQQQGGYQQPQQAPQAAPQPNNSFDDFDDDIPF